MAAVSATAALVALAGCGSQAKNDAQVRQLQNKVDQLQAQASSPKPTISTPAATQTPDVTTETPVAAATSAAPVAPAITGQPAGTQSAEATVSFVMPSFVGMNLQVAQDRVQTYGIFYSTSHDVAGHRMQLVDSNWKVCDQTPPVGTRMRGTVSEFEGKIDFGVVKMAESCP
jgi:hypothetical protein